MAASFINGVQGQGVGTSLKHFAVNNQETRRLTISAEIDERSLREIYLPAFETAVKKAKPWTVMCAYNKVNGTFCSENYRLLVEILKQEWGFEGFVVSDWGAVHDRVASLKGGLDLEMPGPRAGRVKSVVEAVRSGELDESMLDESVRRILAIVFKGAETSKGGSFDIAAHHALARRIAADGMILLKNNGILPLKDQKRVAVIGRAAKKAYYQGGGSSHINPTQVDNPLEELQKLAGKARLIYSEGYPDGNTLDQPLIDSAVDNARSADIALLYLALPDSKESEGYDRPDLDLTDHEVALIKAVTAVQPNTVVILNNGAPVVMNEWIAGPAAVLESWMMGQAGGGAIADVLYGKVNPSGKLAETFPLKLVDTPAYINFPGGNGEVHYGEGMFIGYRYYDAKQIPVQFPFGFGMSYTTFAYKNPRVSAKTFKDTEGLIVSVDVTNTGKVVGREVVQVYVHDHKSLLVRPPKELKGFIKIELQPEETRTVTVQLDFRAFAYFHPAYHQWITENGDFDILIGSSSTDIRCIQTVMLESSLVLPSLLNRESTLHDWMEDSRGKRVIAPLLQQMATQMKSTFGGGEETENEAMGFLMEIPLLDALQFQESTLPVSPAELVDGLLAQVKQIS
jgi:beta-glucosidase